MKVIDYSTTPPTYRTYVPVNSDGTYRRTIEYYGDPTENKKWEDNVDKWVKRYGDARRGIIKTDEEYAEEERKAKEKQKQEDDGSLYTTIYRPLPNVVRIIGGSDDTGEKYVTSPYGK